MIESNTSDYNFTLSWNEYMRTFIACGSLDGKDISFPLRAGQFTYRGVDVSVTVPDECNRYDCDMKQALVSFS